MLSRRIAFLILIAVLSAVIGVVRPAGAHQTSQSTAIGFVPLGTYVTGLGTASGETVAVSGSRMFVTNSDDNSLDIVDVAVPAAPVRLARIDLNPYGAGPNSVAVSNGIVAVAVEAAPKTDPGQVVLFTLDGVYVNSVPVGSLPDMVTFTPDGKHLLVANEGEPNDDYTIDPQGSVTILTVQPLISAGRGRGAPQAIKTAEFSAFNAGGARHAELDPQIRIFGPGASVAQDLEPEYIAVSPDSRTAYVTLQENNALAVIDVNTGKVERLAALGAKDHRVPGNGLDASDRDSVINIRNWPVYGLYMPDAIAAFETAAGRFLVTANEGDSRDYDGYSEEVRVGSARYVLDPNAFPNAADLKKNANLGRLTVTIASGDTDGDGDYDRMYAFGGRSFSIWSTDGTLVWDSGDQFEQITATIYPNYFNASNDNAHFDDRSDNKGPEPEGVTVGAIGDRTYAFVALERIGGVMVYDISTPQAPVFVQYINNRDFANPEAPDSGPEIVRFIPAEQSPSGRVRLVVANEISGSVTIYEVQAYP